MGEALSLKPVASSTFSAGSNPPRSALDGPLLKATWPSLLGGCSGDHDSSQKAGFNLLGIENKHGHYSACSAFEGKALAQASISFGSTCTSSFFFNVTTFPTGERVVVRRQGRPDPRSSAPLLEDSDSNTYCLGRCPRTGSWFPPVTALQLS